MFHSIVAVHGIGAHPDDTWTKFHGTHEKGDPTADRIPTSSNSVRWLLDEKMLPATLPNCRIMRYGYKSDWFGKESIATRLSVLADRFLESLKRYRQVAFTVF
jgi:hypothetical protein